MHDLKVKLPKGKYIVATSGGVDSMVLLYVLSKQPNLELVVAHLDHGVRPDSYKDKELVDKVSKRLNLTFVSEKLNMGSSFSEAKARDARYEFLRRVMNEHEAKAILTAHHQNDQLETAIFNLIRGTGRQGLSSLKSTDVVIRPLLHLSKDEIYDYALDNGIEWNEDSTNLDTKYKRNYIRHEILPKLRADHKQQLSSILSKMSKTNKSLDLVIADYLKKNSTGNKTLLKHSFVMLPHKVAREVMASWLRQNDVRDFDSKHLDKLTIATKTLKPGRRVDVNVTYIMRINKDSLVLETR